MKKQAKGEKSYVYRYHHMLTDFILFLDVADYTEKILCKYKVEVKEKLQRSMYWFKSSKFK